VVLADGDRVLVLVLGRHHVQGSELAGTLELGSIG